MSEVFFWQDGFQREIFTIEPVKDRSASGFWLGDGVFETLRFDSGEVFAVDRHLRRLRVGAERLGIDYLDPNEGITAAVLWLSERLAEKALGQIRVTLLSSRSLLVHASEFQPRTSALRVVLYPYPKNEQSILAGIKSLSYGENTHALRFAGERGFEEALLSNFKGEVIESALANFIYRIDGNWFTPPLSAGALPGVTRELLIENFGVIERTITINELQEVESAALTSSLRGIHPIAEIYDTSKSQGFTYVALSEVDRIRLAFEEWRLRNPQP
jgi:branched-chain amino acid aminotransferase